MRCQNSKFYWTLGVVLCMAPQLSHSKGVALLHQEKPVVAQVHCSFPEGDKVRMMIKEKSSVGSGGRFRTVESENSYEANSLILKSSGSGQAHLFYEFVRQFQTQKGVMATAKVELPFDEVALPSSGQKILENFQGKLAKCKKELNKKVEKTENRQARGHLKKESKNREVVHKEPVQNNPQISSTNLKNKNLKDLADCAQAAGAIVPPQDLRKPADASPSVGGTAADVQQIVRNNPTDDSISSPQTQAGNTSSGNSGSSTMTGNSCGVLRCNTNPPRTVVERRADVFEQSSQLPPEEQTRKIPSNVVRDGFRQPIKTTFGVLTTK